MALMKPEQFEESLKALKPRIFMNGKRVDGCPRATSRTDSSAAGAQSASTSSCGALMGPAASTRADNRPRNGSTGIPSGTRPSGNRRGSRRVRSCPALSRSISSTTNRPSRSSPSRIRSQPGASSSPDSSSRPCASGRSETSQDRRSGGAPASSASATYDISRGLGRNKKLHDDQAGEKPRGY